MSFLRYGMTILGVSVAILGILNSAMAAEVTILSAEKKADLALCRGGRGQASMNDRVRLLSESITEFTQLLPTLSDSVQRQQVSKELAQLRDYKSRSEKDDWFWDYGSTCPRQLNFPNTAIDLTSKEGVQEATQRALDYTEIATCVKGQRGYAIKDRLGFLDSAIAIIQKLKTLGIQNDELNQLLPMSKKAHQDPLSVWDVGSTCPCLNNSCPW